MAKYTPTKAMIEDAYVQVYGNYAPGVHEMSLAEFDRWLAARDREVAAKALREFRTGFGRRFAFQDPYGHFDSGTVSALHRQVEGMLDAEIDRIEAQANEKGAVDEPR